MFGKRGGWAARLSWTSVICLGAAVGVLVGAGAAADALLRQPFARQRGGAVVAIFANHTVTGRPRELTSFATFTDWRRAARVFEQVSGYASATLNLLGEPEPITLRAAVVAERFFDTLDMPLAHGRGFRLAEHSAGLAQVCVISDALWHTRFGAAPDVVGRSIRLDQLSGMARSGIFTIVGIAPPRGTYPEEVELWMPYVPTAAQLTNRSGQWFSVVGRLRARVTPAQADADMRVVAAGAPAEHSQAQPPYVPNLVPLREVLTAKYEGLVAGLGAAAVLLLLVVTASISGVLAARALREAHADVIRLSLGARRRDLLSAAARDGLLLGLLAAAISLPCALGALALINRLGRQMLETPLDLRLTWMSVGGGVVTAVGVAVTLALLVKGQALRRGWWTVVPHAPGGNRGTRATARVRNVLIVAEIALSVVLLAAAATLFGRVAEIRATDLGLEVDHLLTVRVTLPASRYDDARGTAFFTELLERINGLPGVRAAAVSSDDPLLGVSANPEFTVLVEDRPQEGQQRLPIVLNGVSAEYFDVLGLHLVEGEIPPASGAARETLSVLVNRTFVRSLFSGERAIGRRFRYGGRNPPWWTIAGVVDDTRNDGPLAPTRPMAYLPYPAFGKSDMTLLVRVANDARSLIPPLRTIVRDMDRDLPIGRIALARDLVEARSAGLQVGALVMAGLALAALLLSGVGLQGVLAAAFAQSATEIGVRMAIGASPADVMRLVLARTATLAIGGLAVGTVLTGLAGLTLRRFVAGAVPRPQEAIAVLVGVALVSLLAGAWPAWKATRVKPIDALRAE